MSALDNFALVDTLVRAGMPYQLALTVAALAGSGGNSALFTATTAGTAPASGGGALNFLRADGVFAAPTPATYSLFTAGASGLAPASGGGTATFLRADGTWQTTPGSGDMALSAIQVVSGQKTFNDGSMVLAGLTSGTAVLKAAAVAGVSTWTFPSAVSTVVGRDTADTLTNKTLTLPSIASILSGGFTLTLPAATDTIVARATTENLSNKTLVAPVIVGTSVVPTQVQGDNSTKVSSTAYVDAARQIAFTSAVNGAVPASGGGTTTFLRADGTFATPPSTAPTNTAYATAIPLDLINGREMGSTTMTVNTVLTVAAGAVINGNVNLTLVANGFTLDMSAFTLKGPDTFVTTPGQVHELSFLQRTIGQKPYAYCSLGVLLDVVAPAVSGSPHVDDASPTIVRQLYGEALVSNGIVAADCAVSGSTVLSVAISGLELQITVSAAVVSGTTPTLSVAANKLKDAAGNLCIAISASAITNNILPVAPTITLGVATSTTQPMTLTAPAGMTSRTVQVRTTAGPGTWGAAAGAFVSNVFTATGLTASTSYDYQASSTGTAGTSAFGSAVTGSTAATGTTITDTFNRVDASVIGARSDGGAWTAVAGFNPMGISTNRAVGTVNSAYNGFVADIAATSYTATLLGIDYSNTECSFVYRYLDASNYCVIAFQGASTSYRCYEVVAGTATAVAFNTSASVLGANSPGAGARDHRFIVTSTSITVQNGVSGTYTTMDSVTHSTLGSNTKTGFRCNGAGAFLDNFAAA